jgi:hypothetical protein
MQIESKNKDSRPTKVYDYHGMGTVYVETKTVTDSGKEGKWIKSWVQPWDGIRIGFSMIFISVIAWWNG